MACCCYSCYSCCYISCYMAKPTTTLSNILVPFAEAASINPRDAANTLKKRIIVSLGFIDARQLYDALFPSTHMDWDAVLPYAQKVTLTVDEWCEVISLLHFIREPERPKHVAEMVTAALAGLTVTSKQQKLTPIESMQLSFARAGMAPAWDVLAKSLLLCNIADLDHAAALQRFLGCESSAKSSCGQSSCGQSSCGRLISNIGSHRHTPDEYTAAFALLLSNDGCHVSAHHIINSLKLKEEELERMRQNARAMMRSSQKPSLTAIVSALATANKNTAAGNSGNFAAFCSGARMQGNTSLRVRRTVYYLKTLLPDAAAAAASPASNHKLIGCIVGEDQFVMEALARIPQITTPDVAVLRLFLEDVRIDAEPPLCLRAFKDAVGIAGHNWTTVLRMYLAAYSGSLRELWEHAVTLSVGSITVQHYYNQHNSNIVLIAPETEKNIRAFVAERPFAYDEMHTSMFLG
jgi:hypothetical protein